MSIATQEVRRNRLFVALLAVCLTLAAVVQLNGRSVFAIGEGQGKDAAFAAFVQPHPRSVASNAGLGPIGRLLDSASRSFAEPARRAAAPAPSTPPSSGTTPELAAASAPATVPATSAAAPAAGASQGPSGVPPFNGLLSQLSPISGPVGFVPTATPTPEASPTPPVEPTPTPTSTPPVTEPTATPTPPVTEPTPPIASPTPTPPIIVDPTTPVSPVPEPATWALWLLGFGLVGGLIRWRRRALGAAKAEDAGGNAA